MKNFRKVLALVLVVATLFSFVAMASAKKVTDYKDYADINYVEAVGVLTSVGINEGHDTGYFAPQDTIDRDEVAAMVARLRNGGTLNADLYVGAEKVFADVKGQWSEGYVTYAAQLGIIAGRNASTFDPDAKVTGVETMKMLLCVLGYDQAIQGYTGANWQVNVIRDAKKADLLIDGVDPYKPATREEVTQYFLNALTAKMVVGYLGEGVIKLTNSIWVDFDKFDGGVATPDAVGSEYEVTYKNAVLVSDTLAHKMGLTVDYGAGYDCYMRPCNVWYLNDVEIGSYAIAPSAKWVSADVATIGETADPEKADGIYVNGRADAFHTGNGVVVEYFAAYDRFVVIDTFIGKVANVSEYYDTFDIIAADGDTALIENVTLSDYEVAEGDMVLFWACNDYDRASRDYYLHDCEVVKPINADVTEGDVYARGYLNPESCFVAGGKSYNYAWNLGGKTFHDGAYAYDAEVSALNMADVVEENNYNIYLDKEDFVIYLAPKAAEAPVVKYAYVVEETGWATSKGYGLDGKEVYSYVVDMVNFAEKDGALNVEEDVASDKGMFDKAASRYANIETWDGDAVGMLVAYTDVNGVATLQGKPAHFAPLGAMLAEDKWVIKSGEVFATSKTVFMIRTLNIDGTYSYEQVTGYENLNGTYIAEMVYNAKGNERTNIMYFADDAGFATYVFIDAKYQVAEADHFLVLDPVNYVRFEKALENVYADDYLVYDAIVDGERAVVASAQWLFAGAMYDDLLTFRGFVATVGGEKLPLYVLATRDTEAINTVALAKYVADDEIYIYVGQEVDPYKLAKDAIIYIVDVDEDGNTVTTQKLYKEMLGDDENFDNVGYVYTEGDYITELYLFSDGYLGN